MPEATLKVTKPRTKSQKTRKLGEKTQAILRIKGEHPTLNTREIGELAECDHSHVVRVLARYGVEQGLVEKYKRGRADIFAGIQGRILDTITNDDIKKASLQQKVTAAGILYDKERLERGESTSNTISIVADIEAVRRAKVEGKRQVDVETVQD
jgi:hypothetical protein